MSVVLLTEPQAAERLCISRSTLRRWKQAGKISPFQLGDVLRYSSQVIDAFIAAHTGPNTGDQQCHATE
jgi:excisionase family DNA binding protein